MFWSVLVGLTGLGGLSNLACTRGGEKEHPAAQADHPSGKSIDSQKKVIWTCPMHPQIKKDGPGSCPICGMNLVKNEQDEEIQPEADQGSSSTMPTGHAAFHLTDRRMQMIGVKSGVVEKKPVFKSISAAGRLAFDPELYTAQNEYLEAIRQMARVKDSPIEEVLHSAKRMVESSKLRLKILGLSDREISKIGSHEGVEPSGGSLLLHKAGEAVWVYAEVYEMDLPYVRPGLSAEITASFLGGKPLAAQVISVDRVINPTTRTAKVRIRLPKADIQLRPESYVDVVIHVPMGEQITVPFDAVLETGKESWVFVTDGKGHFTPKKVGIKFRADDNVALEGVAIHEGDQIVTSANFLIDSESRLKGVLEADADSTGGEHVH